MPFVMPSVIPTPSVIVYGYELAETTMPLWRGRYGLTHLVEMEQASDVKPAELYAHERIAKLGTILSETGGSDPTRILVDNKETPSLVIQISPRSSGYNILIAGRDEAVIADWRDYFRSVLPEALPVSEEKIGVRFWWNTSDGPRSMNRKLVSPQWTTIRGNYEDTTAGALDAMMTNFQPAFGGQVVIWHGKPGTGKTYALRALCREWSTWCKAEYIIDPENLFGPNAGYLVSTLLGRTSSSEEPDTDDDAAPPSGWKLLILEDTGELVSETAKQDTGQGLSRLLNIADGFIGQGLKVLILITTNQVLDKLHEAVTRPGRAAHVVEFKPLAQSTIRKWAQRHDVPLDTVPRHGILADMYGAAQGFANHGVDIRKEIGFHER
jgi:hypothetical protein